MYIGILSFASQGGESIMFEDNFSRVYQEEYNYIFYISYQTNYREIKQLKWFTRRLSCNFQQHCYTNEPLPNFGASNLYIYNTSYNVSCIITRSRFIYNSILFTVLLFWTEIVSPDTGTAQWHSIMSRNSYYMIIMPWSHLCVKPPRMSNVRQI